MLVTCQNCHRVYKVADDSLKDGEHTFKCQICGFTWTTLLERDLPKLQEEEPLMKEDVATEEIPAEERDTLSTKETTSEEQMTTYESATNIETVAIEKPSDDLPAEHQEAPQPDVLKEKETRPQETLISEPTPANLDETLSQVVELLSETNPIPADDEVIITEEVLPTIPELEQFEEMTQQQDYSRFAPKEEEEVALSENTTEPSPASQEEENIPTPSPFERGEPEIPTAFIDPERQEPMPIAPEFPALEIPSENDITHSEEDISLKEEPLLPIRKKGNIFWGLIGYLLFLLVFGGLILWLGEPLLKRFFPAITPFYDRAYEIYDEISEKVASTKGIEYVRAVYKKIDIRTKAVGEGLDLTNVQTRAVYENNILTLNISGTIVNNTDEEKMLPFLYFVVYDKDGNELQNLTNVPKKESLKGREKLPFKGKITSLHPDSAKADITFRKE